MKKRVELLAPAGARTALIGAISAGADAIYLGGERFGARAYADNFSTEDIITSIEDAHLFGRKIYLTVNTLTTQEELSDLCDWVFTLYQHGLDGVIVQDLGVLRELGKRCPTLELHASTQCSVTGVPAVKYLRELGVRRVVPARELSLQEMKAIADEGIEVEAFIHGAMCYCYSGKCLLSSFLGGRSGNRGRCAGPCRLPYEVHDERGKVCPSQRKEGYPLSMKDMCVLDILPELIDAGIASFKIEGRMKRAEYAAGVTAIYRKYIDTFYEWDAAGRQTPWKVEKEDLDKLKVLYLRSDLSTGYYHMQNGKDMMTLDKPGYVGADEQLLQDISKEYLQGLPKLPIEGNLVVTKDAPAILTVWTPDGAHVTSAESSVVASEAMKQPMTEEGLRERMEKTGDTVFTFSSLSIQLEDGLFLPVGALNELRREALKELRNELVKVDEIIDDDTKKSFETEKSELLLRAKKPSLRGLLVQVSSKEQLTAAMAENIQAIAVDYDISKEDLSRCNTKKIPVLLVLPPVTRAHDHVFMERALKELKEGRFQGAVVQTMEQLSMLKENQIEGILIADHQLYAWNTSAASYLLKDTDVISAPVECNRKELFATFHKPAGLYLERMMLTVYGRTPLMITANCVAKTTQGCEKKQCFFSLLDRKNEKFPVRLDCRHCLNVIYNSVPTSLHNFTEDAFYKGVALRRLVFTTESAATTSQVISFYDGRSRDASIFQHFTTGHYKKGAL